MHSVRLAWSTAVYAEAPEQPGGKPIKNPDPHPRVAALRTCSIICWR